ncbi:MAG TPA: DUF3108 domain-containing protein [Bryobacteraceae bacterium]|nr:DUF3108 domain-containing protein [Bryobacteraceae bacterium]
MIGTFRDRRMVLAGAAGCWLLLFCKPFDGAPKPVTSLTGFPFTNETLRYAVNWPTGVSLGEARMTATRTRGSNGNSDEWTFEMSLDASVPGFTVADRYHATASPDLCSATFDKEFSHGAHKSHERITFDQHAGTAHRETVGAGKSDVDVSGCARDALTFLYFARRELGQGHIPPQEKILFGAPYQARLEYTGPQWIGANGKKSETDRVVATLKGPASEISFEIFFARDAARTPLLIRVPLSLGMFSMELAR